MSASASTSPRSRSHASHTSLTICSTGLGPYCAASSCWVDVQHPSSCSRQMDSWMLCALLLLLCAAAARAEVQPTTTMPAADAAAAVHVAHYKRGGSHHHRKDLYQEEEPKPYYGDDDGAEYNDPEYRYYGGRSAAPQMPLFDAPPSSGGCLTSLDAVADAFNRGSVAKCVDNSILARIEKYYLPIGSTTKNDMFQTWINSRSKSSTFWSYGDNVEKYIRIGRSQLVLGVAEDSSPDQFGGFQAGNFPGVRDPHNFAALLEAIGYDSSSTDPTRAFMFIVVRRPKHKTGVPQFIPTWSNAASYYSWFVQTQAITDAAARAQAGITDAQIPTYLSFTITPETVNILTTKQFAELTGCQAQCTIEDTYYGTTLASNWTTPTIAIPRIDPTTCNTTGYDPARYQLTAPTSIRADSDCSNADWNTYRDQFKGLCGIGLDVTANHAAALTMAKAYLAAAGDATKQAVVWRAFLYSNCAGSYNPLFSGDAYTYTGNGGFLGATGTEYVTGETIPQDVPAVFPVVRVVFFCPWNQAAGALNPYARCPASIGTFDADYFRARLNAPWWDVAELVV